jgi:hypothetical protein
MNTEVGRYRQGALPGRSLQSAIDEAMEAIASDDAELSGIGISKEDFLTVHLEVQEEAGFVVEGILLAIAIGAGSNISADVAEALWNKVLKRVRRKRGDDVIGPEEKPGQEAGRVSG